MNKEKEVTRKDVSNKLREIGEMQIDKVLKSQREEFISIVQKEIATSDKYTIAPLQRIMSNLIKEDE